MSKRLQVVMSEEEYQEVQQAAAMARTTVSEWVRRCLRAARTHQQSRSGDESDGPEMAAAVRERSPSYGNLLERVMRRYDLPDEGAAVRFALRRAADPPLSTDEILAMEGTGWEGDLEGLRSSEKPEKLP